MANKAIEILKKAEHDLGIEIKMWQNQNRPEIASRCKIKKVQVKQAIEKLCWGEESNAQSNCNIHSVINSVCDCFLPEPSGRYTELKDICCKCHKAIAN